MAAASQPSPVPLLAILPSMRTALLRGEDALAQSARRLTASSAMPSVRDAAPGSRGGRFFAVPFDAIAGFGEVAEAARSLAKLPVDRKSVV